MFTSGSQKRYIRVRLINCGKITSNTVKTLSSLELQIFGHTGEIEELAALMPEFTWSCTGLRQHLNMQ